MASVKRLSGVCHNIAHHSVSTLSYIHPHLRKACEAANLHSIEVDLLSPDPCPESFIEIEPLRLSLRALRTTFERLLNAEGFHCDDLDRALLRFEFPDQLPDDHCSNCHAWIATKSGRQFRKAVDYFGNEIVPNIGAAGDAQKDARA